MTLWIYLLQKTIGSQPECFPDFSVYKESLGDLLMHLYAHEQGHILLDEDIKTTSTEEAEWRWEAAIIYDFVTP